MAMFNSKLLIYQRVPVLQNMLCLNKIIMEKRGRLFFSNDNGEHGGGARNTVGYPLNQVISPS
jgi:hypothetical protein